MMRRQGSGMRFFWGFWCKFVKCMYLFGERLCRFQAARSAVQIPGALVACPVSGLRLNCCFLIFSAISMPRIVTAAVSNRLKPEHRTDSLFYSPMVLFDHVIQVLRGSHSH